MTRQIWFLLFAFLLVPAPSSARPQLKPLPVLASQVSAPTADSVRFVGGSAAMRSGEDIGAQINAAYASLPPTGGTIAVISPANGQCYSFSTPIVAAVPGKYLLLQGGAAVGSQVKWVPSSVCLEYALRVGTAITLDYVPVGSVGNAMVTHGIQNMTLANGHCETLGGCGGNAVGVELGGAQGATLADLRVIGFATGLNVQKSEARGELTFRDCSLSYNTTGFLDLEADGAHISFDGCQFLGNATAVSSAASLRISNSSIVSSTVLGVNCLSPAACDLNSDHFQTADVDSTHFLTGNGVFSVVGGDMRDDRTTGKTDWWMNFAGASFFVIGVVVTSAGRSATQVIESQTKGIAALQNTSVGVLKTLYSDPSSVRAATLQPASLSMSDTDSNLQGSSSSSGELPGIGFSTTVGNQALLTQVATESSARPAVNGTLAVRTLMSGKARYHLSLGSFKDFNMAPRSTDFLYTDNAVGNPHYSAASSFYVQPTLRCVLNNGMAQECDAVLFSQKIIRPFGGQPGRTYSGVAFAAPIDGGGNTKYDDAASVRIESSPSLATCNRNANGSLPMCWALAVDAGASKFGSNSFFIKTNTGLHMNTGRQDSNLEIVNEDPGYSSSIIFGTAAVSRFTLDASGARFSVTPVPSSPGDIGLGSESLPFRNLFLGGTAGNNAGISGTFAQPTVLMLPDPGASGVGEFAYRNVDQSWHGNQRHFALVEPTVGGGNTIEKIVLGDTTLRFVSIAPRECQEQITSVSGASASGVVSASPSGDLGSANLLWQVHMTSQEAATIRMCNLGTKSVIPNTVGWRIFVIQ